MPDVTVLMTVYNGMPFLSLAIESILNQTYTDFAFLIVDDCSSDHSRRVVRSYKDSRIRLLENRKNLGQTESLNRGLAHIQTDLVARMDADDISHPGRLAAQVRHFENNPHSAAVGTNLRTIDPNGRTIGSFRFPEKDLTLRWMQLFNCPASCGAVMFQTRLIRDELGGFDPSIRYAQDWELWSRVLPKYRLANVPQYLLDVREHPGASSAASNRVMLAEKYRINRLNPERILGIDDRSEEWLSKVDTLLSKNVRNPEQRLAVIDRYFDVFRQRYPEAVQDDEILNILGQQYVKCLYHCHVRSLPRAIRALTASWSAAPVNFSRFPRQCLVSIAEIPGHLKYWIGRNIFGDTH